MFCFMRLSSLSWDILSGRYYRRRKAPSETQNNREESGGLSSLSANWRRVLRQHLNCPLTKLLHSHLPCLLPKRLLQQGHLLRIVYLVPSMCAFSIGSQNRSEKHTKGKSQLALGSHLLMGDWEPQASRGRRGRERGTLLAGKRKKYDLDSCGRLADRNEKTEGDSVGRVGRFDKSRQATRYRQANHHNQGKLM
jgi:hypothetical protein